jgi:spore germination protein KB
LKEKAQLNEQTFSTRQAISMTTMFLIGQVLIFYNGSPAKTDIMISVLIAWAATIPLSLLYARLVNVFPGRNPFDLQLEFFGPVFGRVTALLYIFYSMHIASLVTRNFTTFIQITSLTNTPQFMVAIFIGVLCIYCIKSGINTISRYAAMALPVYLLILILITLLSVTIWIDPSHITPFFYNGFKPILKSAIDLAAFPFSDALLLPFVLQPLKEHRKARKIFLTSYAISTAIFLLVFVRNVLVLGDNLTFKLYFPSYVSISLINIGDFLQRIEVAIGAVLFMGAFIKIALYLYVASLGVSKVLGFGDYKKYIAPMGFMMIALSQFAYPNITVDLAFAANIYPYYVLTPGVVLPVITWLTAEWKRKKLKKNGQLPDEPPSAEETLVVQQES